MKRFTALALAAVLAFGMAFAGCAAPPSEDGPRDNPSEMVTEGTSAAAEDMTEAVTEAAMPQTEAAMTEACDRFPETQPAEMPAGTEMAETEMRESAEHI